MTIKDAILTCEDFENLKKEIQDGKNAKTIMLISKDEEYSFAFAKLLSCLIFNDGQWEENENFLKVESGSHPDLKIYPTKNQLLVADSEEIVFESSVKPILANKKIFIIKNIEKSMEASQNKLLKTLEEPSKDSYFILTTANPNLVLPTIKSRCSKVELCKINKEVISRFVEGENAEIITALSDGLIGKAQKLSKIKNLRAMFDGVLDCMTRLSSSKEVLAFSKKLTIFKDDFNLFVDILSLIVEELLYHRAGQSKLFRLKSASDRLERVVSDYSFEALIQIQKLIIQAEKEMVYNCNFTLVVENLLLNILEVKYLCK